MPNSVLKISSLLLLLTCQSLLAQEVTTSHNKLLLNAELKLAEGSTLADGVLLITHGTLAHNKMEVIATLQDLLTDAGINTLAINLSLGIDNRHGMYDCQVPHQHKHSDAIDEINTWSQWLKSQGAGDISLMGHSRGGNQTAWFSDSYPDQVKSQILLAPATWNEAAEQNDYKQRYNISLAEILTQAQQGDDNTWMDATNFIYCTDSRVKATSFVNYYSPDQRFDTPYLLDKTSTPSLVISGSEDNTVSDLAEKMANISNPRVEHISIEGADHFFRDLYADEVVEFIVDFMEQQQ